MRMQKVNPAIGSAGIHNNFLGQTLIQPDFTALHHDEIITVKLQIMTLLFLAADFIDDVKLIEIG